MTKKEAVNILLNSKKIKHDSLIFRTADGYFIVEGVVDYLTVRDNGSRFILNFNGHPYQIDKKSKKLEDFIILAG